MLLVSDPTVELRWTVWVKPDFHEIRMGISARDRSVPVDFRWAVVLMGTAQLVDIESDVIVPGIRDPRDTLDIMDNLDLTSEEVGASNRGVRVVAHSPDQADDLASRGLPDDSPIEQVVAG